MTDGGDGIPGDRPAHWYDRVRGDRHYSARHNFISPNIGKNNGSFNPGVFTWQNVKSGEVYTATMYDFRKKYNITQSNVSLHMNHPEKSKSVQGWCIIKRQF